METEQRRENRADVARVLLALAILALISGLDESRSPTAAPRTFAAAETR